MRNVVATLSAIYLLGLLILWGAIHSSLNSHWLVTLFLFSPRWVVALPLLILVPMTLVFRWRWTWIYLVHFIVIALPLLGVRLGSSTVKTRPGDQVLRVLSCNTGGGDLSQELMIDLIREHDIEVLLLQECQGHVAKSLFEQLGWQHRQQRQIAIGSPFDLSEAEVVVSMSEESYRVPVAVACKLVWPTNGGVPVKLVSVHLATFRPAFEKLQALDVNAGVIAVSDTGQMYDELAKEIASSLDQYDDPLIVAGDFNVPIESVHYQNFWTGYRNAFEAQGVGLGYTKFTRFHGVRIDHVLVDSAWLVRSCKVGPDLGGDHRPVLTELIYRPNGH